MNKKQTLAIWHRVEIKETPELLREAARLAPFKEFHWPSLIDVHGLIPFQSHVPLGSSLLLLLYSDCKRNITRIWQRKNDGRSVENEYWMHTTLKKVTAILLTITLSLSLYIYIYIYMTLLITSEEWGNPNDKITIWFKFFIWVFPL